MTSGTSVTPSRSGTPARCRLLLTGRDRGIATAFKARECLVDVLSPEAALSLLSQWSACAESDLPPVAADVARECGYLPLALSLAGAMVRDKGLWEDILQALRDADLSFIQHELANYPHPHVMRALQVSVDFLGRSNEKTPRRYTDLAVFVPKKRVPESAVVTLWTGEGELIPREARALLAELDRKALLRLEGTSPARFVELHDLQWNYVRARTADVTEGHARLVKAYRRLAPGGWPTATDDGYIFDKLAFHLLKANDRAGLYSLVSRPWMQTQFLRTLSHQAFAFDADLAVAAAKGERPVNLPQLVRASVVQATLGELSSQIPPKALAVLAGDAEGPAARARAGQAAHGFAALILDPDQRAEALLLIADVVHASGDVGHAAKLLAEALQAALGVSDDEQRAKRLEQVLTVWGGIRGWADAASVPRRAGDERSLDVLRRVAAGVLGRAGEHKLARQWEVVAGDGGGERAAELGSRSHWELAIESVRAGDLTHAFDLISGEADPNIWPHPAEDLAEAIVEGETGRAAAPLAGRIHDEDLRNRVLYELARALAKADGDRSAQAVALSLAHLDRDDVRRTVEYRSKREEHLENALEAVGAMSESRRAIGFLAVARECASAGDPDVARSLARRAAAGVSRLKDDRSEAMTLSIAAQVLAELGNREEAISHARDALQRAEHIPKNPELADAVLKQAGVALIQLGHAAETLDALDRLTEGIEPTSLEALALALTDAGEFQAAAGLVQRLKDDFRRSEYLRRVAPALAKKGQGTLAVESLRALDGDYYRHEVLALLLRDLVESGAYDDAVRSLALVPEFYRYRLAEKLIPLLMAAEKVRLASDVAYQMDNWNLVSVFLQHFVRTAIEKDGRKDVAATIAASPIPDDTKAEVLKTVAAAWVAAGKHDLALEAARAAKDSDQAEILAELAVAFFKAGDVARAEQALAEIGGDEYRQTGALSGMAEWCLERGDVDQAFQKARAMPLESLSSARTELLMSALSAALDGQRFDLSHDIAASVAEGPDRLRALSDVAFALAREGRRNDAHALLTEVVEMSLSVTAGSVPDEALGEMAQQLADSGCLREARSVAEVLRSNLENARVLRAVAGKEAESDLDRAIATAGLLEDLEEFGVRWIEGDVLLDVAEVLLRQNRPSEAVAVAERARLKTLAAFGQLDGGMTILNPVVPEQFARVYSVFARGPIADPAAAVFSDAHEDLKYRKDDILAAMALQAARRGDAAAALRLALEIGKARERTQSLANIADLLASLGYRDLAREAGALALAHAPAIDVRWQRVEAAGQAAECLIRSGDSETWRRLLSDEIEQSDNRATSAEAAGKVALALAQEGDAVAAREWLKRLARVVESGDAVARGTMALARANLGEIEEAVSVAEQLLKGADQIELAYDLRTKALIAAARVFLFADRISTAVDCLAALDTERDVVQKTLREVVDRWNGRHATRDAERDAGFWLEAQAGARRPPPLLLAALATTIAISGQTDVAVLLMAQAVADSRFAGRDAVFAVLKRTARGMAAVDRGDTLRGVVQGLVEVESWLVSSRKS